MKNLLGVLLMLCSLAAWAAEWSGKVVGVSDGDTLTVMKAGRGTKVRLVEIDAPESRQDYGQRSKQSLSELCFGKNATVHDEGHDKYRRVLGRVFCDGIDVNAEQIKRGMAWFYVQYGKDTALKQAEEDARAAKLGLWAGANQIAPWEYRHGGVTKKAKVKSAIARSTDAWETDVEGKGNKAGFSCGGKSRCGDMSSCAEARFYLEQCGLSRLDRDHDGVPCESICR